MIINQHNKMVIDAWVNGRISLVCASVLLEKEDVILDAIKVI